MKSAILLAAALTTTAASFAQLTDVQLNSLGSTGVFTSGAASTRFDSFISSNGLSGLTDTSAWTTSTGPALSLNQGDSLNVFFINEVAGFTKNTLGLNVGGSGGVSGGTRNWIAGFRDIKAEVAEAPTSIALGDYTTLSNLATAANTQIDFWLNAQDARGGVWSLFNTSANSPADNISHARARSQSYAAANGLGQIYLYAFEDLATGGDRDFNDLIFGVEVIRGSANPNAPVPEPSTYGLLGALGLAALALRRRFARS